MLGLYTISDIVEGTKELTRYYMQHNTDKSGYYNVVFELMP